MRLRFFARPAALVACALGIFVASYRPAVAIDRAPAGLPSYATLQWLGSSPLVVPIERGDDPALAAAKSACAHPQFPLVCVKQGGTGSLAIQENCVENGQPVDCGTVTWTATTSHRGLAASFDPDPGNPTKETISAAKSVKPGKYYQLITAMCTGVPNCPANYKAAIVVLK